MNILAVSGSLREGSYNTALLRAAARQAPQGIDLLLSDLPGQLPLFNPDLDIDPPKIVQNWRKQLRHADAVLFGNPEYAHQISGTLKNALDWIVGSGELISKPVAVLSASSSHLGAGKAHASLLYTLRLLEGDLHEDASVCFASINRKFDDDGNLTDGPSAEAVRNSVQLLAEKYFKKKEKSEK